MGNCQKGVTEGADKATLEKQMEALEKAANKMAQAYPTPRGRRRMSKSSWWR